MTYKIQKVSTKLLAQINSNIGLKGSNFVLHQGMIDQALSDLKIGSVDVKKVHLKVKIDNPLAISKPKVEDDSNSKSLA